MVDLIFDTGLPNGSYLVRSNIVYGTDFSDRRVNQFTQLLATGEKRTYDTGVNVVTGIIVMKNIDRAMGDGFRYWIRNKAVFQLNPFTITVPLWGVDLGNGFAGDIVGATLTSSDMKKIIKYVPPGKYEVRFPYTYLRT